jgi:hypothetical protein
MTNTPQHGISPTNQQARKSPSTQANKQPRRDIVCMIQLPQSRRASHHLPQEKVSERVPYVIGTTTQKEENPNPITVVAQQPQQHHHHQPPRERLTWPSWSPPSHPMPLRPPIIPIIQPPSLFFTLLLFPHTMFVCIHSPTHPPTRPSIQLTRHPISTSSNDVSVSASVSPPRQD